MCRPAGSALIPARREERIECLASDIEIHPSSHRRKKESPSAARCCELFRFDQGVLGFPQISQRGFSSIPGTAYLLLAALALADVDVGADPSIDGVR